MFILPNHPKILEEHYFHPQQFMTHVIETRLEAFHRLIGERNVYNFNEYSKDLIKNSKDMIKTMNFAMNSITTLEQLTIYERIFTTGLMHNNKDTTSIQMVNARRILARFPNVKIQLHVHCNVRRPLHDFQPGLGRDVSHLIQTDYGDGLGYINDARIDVIMWGRNASGVHLDCNRGMSRRGWADMFFQIPVSDGNFLEFPCRPAYYEGVSPEELLR